MFQMDHSEVVLIYLLKARKLSHFRHSLSFIIKGKQRLEETGKSEAEILDRHGSVFNLYRESLNIGETSDNESKA